MTERQSPPAAALPPSAAEPAAGIASIPHEAPVMPAAPFLEIHQPDAELPGVRQWAIEPNQCRWIIADEDAAAEALMCGGPTAPHRPFCAQHCARAYLPRVSEAETKQAEEEALKDLEPKQKEAE